MSSNLYTYIKIYVYCICDDDDVEATAKENLNNKKKTLIRIIKMNTHIRFL